MYYVFDGESEFDWYEKAQDILINHGYWNDEHEPLWKATLNMIFLEFCEIACDEICDIDLMTALNDQWFEKEHWIQIARTYNLKVSLEMIKEYLEEEKFDSLTISNFEEIFCDGIIFENELKEGLIDCLYQESNKMRRNFLKAIRDEVGNDIMNVLFFFYVREDKYVQAWKMYDSSSDLWSLHQLTDTGMYSDNEHVYDEESEVVTDEKTTLYSFVNSGYSIDSSQVLRVMNWIENNFEL
ncbi:hypothetical protein [Paenisporosarcina sp. TG20]|uniref:hypothetical protein n=1 Tax=Paenisporosarcina sp. TG20 TaxID=1211706 RepID=UPI000309583F|nr:hypothetical protein [Paenisporosarcina sp. TG20]